METRPKNLIIGLLVGIVLILIYVFVPYIIQEKRSIKHKQEKIDSLKNSIYSRMDTKRDLYRSKYPNKGYSKEPFVIRLDGKMNIVYKDTIYIDADHRLYANFFLDANNE